MKKNGYKNIQRKRKRLSRAGLQKKKNNHIKNAISLKHLNMHDARIL